YLACNGLQGREIFHLLDTDDIRVVLKCTNDQRGFIQSVVERGRCKYRITYVRIVYRVKETLHVERGDGKLARGWSPYSRGWTICPDQLCFREDRIRAE